VTPTFSRGPGSVIQVSLNTLDDGVIARLEPGAPSGGSADV
jgi:hypothetical protein